jgi:hypothetical protein
VLTSASWADSCSTITSTSKPITCTIAEQTPELILTSTLTGLSFTALKSSRLSHPGLGNPSSNKFTLEARLIGVSSACDGLGFTPRCRLIVVLAPTRASLRPTTSLHSPSCAQSFHAGVAIALAAPVPNHHQERPLPSHKVCVFGPRFCAEETLVVM